MLNRCTACAIGALSVGCMIVLICRVSLVDSLEEGTRGDGRGCDGIYVATILADLEVAIGKALADDVSLAVFLEPLVCLSSKTWGFGSLKNGVAKNCALGIEAYKNLEVATEAHCGALDSRTKIGTVCGVYIVDSKDALLALFTQANTAPITTATPTRTRTILVSDDLSFSICLFLPLFISALLALHQSVLV